MPIWILFQTSPESVFILFKNNCMAKQLYKMQVCPHVYALVHLNL